jgi:hypothetical protein
MTEEHREKLIRFALVSALIIWAGLAYAELGSFMHRGILFARVLNGRPYVSDFVNVYNGAVLAGRCLRGVATEIYDIKVQNDSVKALIAPVVPESPFFLQYPPYFFTLVLPLSLFPMPLAWFCWNVTGAGLFAFSLLKLGKALSSDRLRQGEDAALEPPPAKPAGRQPRADRTAFHVLVLAFCSYPAWLSVELGQTSFFLAAAAAFMLYFLIRKKYMPAGIVSGIIMIKLQYYPFFFLIGLARGGTRFLLGALFSLAALLAVSAGVLGTGNILQYPHALLSGETGQAVSGVSSFMMQNLRGELVLICGGENPLLLKSVLAVFVICLSGVAWLCFQLVRRQSTNSLACVSALSIMIALLASPHTHTQDYLLLSVAGLLFWNLLASEKSDWHPLSQTLSSNLLIFFSPVSWLLFFLQPLARQIALQPFFIWLACLTVLLACRLGRLGTTACRPPV